MSEVCNFIINQLTKYLYTRQLTSLFYFKKKDLSIAESFRNIQFLLHLPVFTLDKVCFISNKHEPRIHRKHFSKHLHFTSFSLFLTGNGVCNISNLTNFLINQLEKYCYTRHLTLLLRSNKLFVLSNAEVFRKIDFLPHLYPFSQVKIFHRG